MAFSGTFFCCLEVLLNIIPLVVVWFCLKYWSVTWTLNLQMLTIHCIFFIGCFLLLDLDFWLQLDMLILESGQQLLKEVLVLGLIWYYRCSFSILLPYYASISLLELVWSLEKILLRYHPISLRIFYDKFCLFTFLDMLILWSYMFPLKRKIILCCLCFVLDLVVLSLFSLLQMEVMK